MAGEMEKDLIEKLIAVNRVTKVVKGGRIMRFSAVMVVGDGNGRVGMGLGKAREVPLAVQKAIEAAKANMMRINLMGDTIYHEATGRHGAAVIYIKPASAGTGVIAGGAVRMLFDAAGIRDILAKNIGSTNPHNILRAALKALDSQTTPAQVAEKRGLPRELIKQRHRAIGVS